MEPDLSLLFSHFEYVGTDFEGDMRKIAEDPTTHEWWRQCEPCQEPLKWEGKPPSEGGDGGAGGSWWAPAEEVFHCGHAAVEFR